jgi:[acyl-carrier-protein] S-malonyltransferase
MSLALVFPGQGAQAPGMGIGLFDNGSPAHEMAEEASGIAGFDVIGVACEGGEDEIRPTEVAQPLLLLHSVALLRLLPDAVRASVVGVAGHSLGEYTALVAAGSLGWRDALATVRERGLAMAEAGAAAGGGQGMSAVLGMDEGTVDALLKEVGDGIVVANINAPGQVVISGTRAALDSAAEKLKAAGAKRVMSLAVAGAFHSPLMAGAAARLGAALDRAPIVDGRPQAFNVDGAMRTAAAGIRDALGRQLTSSVRWTDCVTTLRAAGAERFIELGPGGTLTAMGKRIDPAATWEAVSNPAAVAGMAA